MRRLVVTVCVSCAVAAALAAWGWRQWLDTEISPSEYGALYALRRMAPEFFMEKMLPELEKALADKRLTHREVRAIEKQLIETKLGGIGPLFLKAVKDPSLDEQLGKMLRDMGDKTQEAGRNLSDTLGDALGKTLNDALDYMNRKSEEFTRPKPKPESPSTF